MKRHTYVEEMGLISSEKRVSRPVALVVLGLLALGVEWAIVTAMPFQSPAKFDEGTPAAVASSSATAKAPKSQAVTRPNHATGGSTS